MPGMPFRFRFGISRLIALAILVVIGLANGPGCVAASVATEAVISIQTVRQQPDALQLVTTRLTVPTQATWETDPDAGPLTFTVESGVLTVQLGGGLARIERPSNPLVAEISGPMMPGQPAVLRPGDRLIVVRGFELTVANDEQAPATAIVVRLRQPPADLSAA